MDKLDHASRSNLQLGHNWKLVTVVRCRCLGGGPWPAAKNNFSLSLCAVAQFVVKHQASCCGRDKFHATLLELPGDDLRNHSAPTPGTPVNCNNATRPDTIQPRSKLIQNLICSRVVRLPTISKTTRDGRKEGEKL